MKLGTLLGYSGRKISVPIDAIRHAESLGYDSVWTSEAYGSDAISPAAWILAQTEKIKVGTAIMQMPARSPAMAAMTAMSLAELSGGRFICGLGASGPQVVEGWHGVPYGKPLTRLKEYVGIMRQIFAREAPATFDGEMYQLPYAGADATGLANAGGKDPTRFDVAPFVTVVMGDDVEQCMMPVRGSMALYVGGMGARNKNFYTDYARRLGFEEDAVKIQDLYLSGCRDEAMAAVPAELIDACHLVGPAERIRDRLQRWREAEKRGHVSSMIIGCQQPEALALVAEQML